MENKQIIRLIKSTDIPEVLEIYKPFITSTSISPEYDVPNLRVFSAKIKRIANYYPVLVCEVANRIIGYAFANKYRSAQGHQWSAETSIYLSPDYYGKGVAKTLYQVLLTILKLQNYINVFAGIVLPNKRSEVFHKKLGFQNAGVFKRGIYKLGSWHDVKWFQLNLMEHIKNPPLPKPVKEIMHAVELMSIFKKIE
jgi:L-amino acid N-acyltransferase YncA